MSGAIPTAVLGYLRRENRPYSVTDVHNNMHREHGKTAIQQALDSLVVAGSVRQKDNGKQKIYVAVESDPSASAASSSSSAAATNIDARELEERLATLKSRVASAQAELGVKQAKVNRAEQNPAPLTSEANQVVDNLQLVVTELRVKLDNAIAAANDRQDNKPSCKRQKLDNLKSGGDVVDDEDKEAIVKRKTQRMTEWRVRKRAVMDLIDSIMQQDDVRMNRDSLYEEIGIETDESVGLSGPT